LAGAVAYPHGPLQFGAVSLIFGGQRCAAALAAPL